MEFVVPRNVEGVAVLVPLVVELARPTWRSPPVRAIGLLVDDEIVVVRFPDEGDVRSDGDGERTVRAGREFEVPVGTYFDREVGFRRVVFRRFRVVSSFDSATVTDPVAPAALCGAQ